MEEEEKQRQDEQAITSNKMAIQVWILGFINLLNIVGWTSYTAMFAYYMIFKFQILPLFN